MPKPVISTIGSWESDNVTVAQVEKALSDLHDRYQVDPEVLRTDLHDLIGQLVDAGLLAPRNGSD